MQTIVLRARVGKDGILHLDVPVAIHDADLEVTLTIQPSPPAQVTTPEELGWSPGFFEQTFGAWQGEPLVRESQGEYQERSELPRSTCSIPIPVLDTLAAVAYQLSNV